MNTPSGNKGNFQQTSLSLFNSFVIPDNSYNEVFNSQGVCRDNWKSLVNFFNSTGAEALKKRHDKAVRMRYEDGATFNPFDDKMRKSSPWAIDIIPMPLSNSEWLFIEEGLRQRAELLEKILKDIYTDQSLITSGHIPAELIYANPNFIHHCHGNIPKGNRFLSFYAVDLYRGADGRFRVLRDYASNPSGLGFALENRIVMSRIFQSFYHSNQIYRLAPFFQAFQNSMVDLTGLTEVDPRIVILSPGPNSKYYFESALLSRYLNFPLVEGQDLSVRNGEVFLKKLTGLEAVDGIFRNISDGDSDPFALRKITDAGVAGLLEVSRDHNIVLSNPVGAGFIDTPALAALLPDISRNLTGRDLAIENHPVWWCRNQQSRNHVLANAEKMVFREAYERNGNMFDPLQIRSLVESTPHGFVAEEHLNPSMVPVWNADGIRAEYSLMRVFLCANGNGFSMMPGGLAITAPDINTLLSDQAERQLSKDIWIYSDRPVETFSLIEGLHGSEEIKRAWDLPSRVADNLLWLGRYMERAEGQVRLMRSVFRRITGEDRIADISELPFLLDLMCEQEIISCGEVKDGKENYQELWQQLDNAIYNKNHPGSLPMILKKVQVAAQNVRDWLSTDSWLVINRLKNITDDPFDDPLDILDEVLYALSAFSGLAMESMTRGLGWRFLDMGRRIERGIFHTSLIRSGISQLYDDPRRKLEALLEIAASIMTYRSRYRTTFKLIPVLDLLIMDESNPKSLAFQWSKLSEHVEHLPVTRERRFTTPEERLTIEMLTKVRLLDPSMIKDMKSDENHSFFETNEEKFKEFAQVISAGYLARVPETPHYSVLNKGDIA